MKACSIESNGGSERKTACWRKGKRCWHVQEGLFVTEREWRLMLRLGWRESVRGIGMKQQKGMEVEWSEREEESGDGEV